ncbi:hypothetical protein REPUB_Repub02eG0075600 [Reevesia pubescens]
MADDLNKLWSKLTLTEEEKMDVCVEKSWEYDGIMPIEKIGLCWCPFWVQIHGLPLGLMNEKVGVVLGESLGDVEEVETLFGKAAWRRFMRVRVLINIHKALKRVGKVTMNDHEPILVSYKYERLPNFCFICGCLDHHESKCDHAIAMKKNVGVITREYGAWMRAEG